jgi:hypothetical protein
MEGPSITFGIRPADCQLAPNDWPIESMGRFDLDQAFGTIGHLHKKIGHDVARTGVLLSLPRAIWRTVQDLDIQIIVRTSPVVPDAQRLFLNVNDTRARDHDRGGSRFELALAANRATLFGTGNEDKRTGRTSSQMKS